MKPEEEAKQAGVVKPEEEAKPSADIRADMIRAQDPPKPKRARAKKPKPAKPAEFKFANVTVRAPEGTKASVLQSIGREAEMMFRSVNALGDWSVSYSRTRVPPDERGRG